MYSCTSPSERDHLLCDTRIILLKQFLIKNSLLQKSKYSKVIYS